MRLSAPIAETVAAADIDEGPHRPHGVLHELGMRMTEDGLVVADAEDHAFGILPVAVEMKDRLLVAAQNPLDASTVASCHGFQPGDILDQAVIVRRRDGDAEIA
jgi:hypothetical protein